MSAHDLVLGASSTMPVIVDEPTADGPGPGTPLLVCFPSAGLASTIVGHHAIRHLKLPRIATVRCRYLPSAAVIFDKRPNPPVRIHGNKTLAVAVSEFPAPSALMLPLAEALILWARKKELGPTIVVEGVLGRAPDGAPQDGPEQGSPGVGPGGPETWGKEDVMGIAATPAREPLLDKAKVPVLVEGIVGGLTAELLNLASIIERDLSVVFVRTVQPGYPDYHAAARLVEILDRVVPGLALDPKPMLEQAEVLERMLKEAMKMGKTVPTPPDAGSEIGPSSEPSMYG
ncbi:MAG: proteasome assembly chaperone family protein [Euryarchaeota archaeon]|nr:proteasome assembly chaperone family protein [Euryarchaeota archaeon]